MLNGDSVFARSEIYSCTNCTEIGFNAFKIVAIVIGFALYILAFVGQTYQGSMSNQDNVALLRILSNYIMLTSVISGFSVKWPNSTREMLDTSKTATEAS